MAARVAGKEKSDSRARMAVKLDTLSRVRNRSDTVGAVEFTAPHALVVELVAVELVAMEEEDSNRRGNIGGAGSSAPNPPPVPLVARRLEEEEVVVAGQVEAVFPGSEAATVWFA
jgi:hypothetical protein